MRITSFVFLFLIGVLLSGFSLAEAENSTADLYKLKVQSISGTEVSLSQYQGKVLLFTNIALKCGTTPQLVELQSLYQEFKNQGLIILGFPSNDFTGVEPSDPGVIHNTCTSKYGVTFPIFAPGVVVGPKKQEVFQYLTEFGSESMQGEIGFNFEKFLVDKKGRIRERFGPFNGALSAVVKKRIQELLAE
jgi:glutathione peroxidase